MGGKRGRKWEMGRGREWRRKRKAVKEVEEESEGGLERDRGGRGRK